MRLPAQHPKDRLLADAPAPARPDGATGVLVIADGTVVWGIGIGAEGSAVGEVCFNTAMTGYQEAMTDPSYAGQIITFTTPHIGNTGANAEDVEATNPTRWAASSPPCRPKPLHGGRQEPSTTG